MEKTIQIFIAGTAFHCTEEAYARLFAYQERLKAHFAAEEESAEILRDIESRIAEKLLERKRALIAIEDVNSVISEIGEVSELEDDVEEPPLSRPGRRLYRDTDNAIVAGVASGIAAYFDVSPLIIRLLFLASIFFGGTGILVYLILWVLIPEAKTAAQKLEMQGRPVTFEAISHVVKAGIKEGRRTGALYSAASSGRRAIGNVLRFATKVFGLLVALGSFFAIIGLTAFLGVILAHWNAPYNDLPIRESSSDLLLYVAVFAGYLSALIPLIFIFALGAKLFRRLNLLPSAIGFGLIGAWTLALILIGVSGSKIAGDYYNFIETNPEYDIVTDTRELEPFDRIVIDGEHVRLAAGETYRATLEGRAKELPRVTFTQEGGVLTVSSRELPESCIFCGRSHPEIVIYVPDLAAAKVSGGSLSFEDISLDELQIAIEHGYINGAITADRLSIDAEGGNLRLNLSVRDLTLAAEGANLRLSGDSLNANLKLRNAGLYADSLILTDAVLEADNSYVELDVRGTFTKTVDDDSTVILEEQTDMSGSTTQEEN